MTYDKLTDEELRVKVAERLGYRWVVDRHTYVNHVRFLSKAETYDCRCDCLKLWDGKERIDIDVDRKDAPEFVLDLNAAMELVGEREFRLSNKTVGGVKYWWCYIGHCVGQSSTPARTICIAWLMFRDAEGRRYNPNPIHVS